MKRVRLRRCLGSALVAVCAVGGCKRPEPTPAAESGVDAARRGGRPSVVLVTLCTFRMSHTGLGGYARSTTPFLDSLAAGGVLFENASSSSSWTKPSVTSIVTGLTPNVHSLTDMFGDRQIIEGDFSPRRVLSDEVVTLGECFRDAGYSAAARINNVQAGDFFNIPQGFDDTVTSHEMDTADMLDDFAGWLREVDPARPFLFFMLSRDAHMPYEPDYAYYLRFNRSPQPVPPERFRQYCRRLESQIRNRLENKRRVPPEMKEQWIDLYDAELAQLDHALSRIPVILRQTGRQSDTLIVVIADHGERFFEHGRIGHAGVTDECVVHVPLIFQGPDVPSRRRVRQIVRSIDVFPTLAAIAGAHAPDVLQGTDLSPLIYGDPHEPLRLTAFSSYMEMHHSVRDGDLKFHVWGDGRRTLFDLDRDAGEQRNIAEEQPTVAARLEDELLHWLDEEEALRPLVAHGDTRELTPEVIEQLRSLGYIH